MNLKETINIFSKSPTETNMSQLVECFEQTSVSDDQIAFLAETIANSGERLDPKDQSITADIPSTGGPSSLSTILCPLFLVQLGYTVPKLNVPGRPAGAIDVLTQIPGYKPVFPKEEFAQLLSIHKYIHILANETFCPLDIKLFEFRKKVTKMSVIPLVIASLLSKKIALNVKFVGLDVRVWEHGNFGRSIHEARENSRRFNRVAKLLGISSKCFLTDSRFPLQPFIGRGESLLALAQIFENVKTPSLTSHVSDCLSMALSLNNRIEWPTVDRISLQKTFETNLVAQGASYNNFLLKIEELKNQPTIVLLAENEGHLNIDLQKIKTAILLNQGSNSASNDQFPDNCGCILLKNQGEYTKRGDPLVILRYRQTLGKKNIILFKELFSYKANPEKTIQIEEVK